ncbi:MAG: hypothetical protein MJ238_00790 [Bacilli bacterium]|nr:hypothetical protein [Bacilli bacterium]
MKLTNKVMVILGAATLLASCGGSNAKTGEAYALCHGGSYVAGATVTVTGDKITAATLGEVCLPSYVQAAEGTAEANYVAGNVTSHGTTAEQKWYKEVKFGNFTLTASTKDDGSLQYTGADFSKAEVCEAYYKAVMDGSCKASGDVTLTKAQLSKDENGYGGANFDWKANRDATVAAFIEYGAEACLAATQADADENGKKYWTVNGVATGATWTDFNKVADGYDSYIKVLATAYNNAK